MTVNSVAPFCNSYVNFIKGVTVAEQNQYWDDNAPKILKDLEDQYIVKHSKVFFDKGNGNWEDIYRSAFRSTISIMILCGVDVRDSDSIN